VTQVCTSLVIGVYIVSDRCVLVTQVCTSLVTQVCISDTGVYFVSDTGVY